MSCPGNITRINPSLGAVSNSSAELAQHEMKTKDVPTFGTEYPLPNYIWIKQSTSVQDGKI